MLVESLSLEDFRNYVVAQADLAPGINAVVGRNAQGKTNLLEAIHCLSGLGSPRGPDSALIRRGSERAVIHARVVRRSRSVLVDMEMRVGRGTRALVNKAPVARAGALQDLTVSVFFGPDELSLVKGSPEGRRRFLDDLVVKLRPAREPLRRELERVLKQRNALLKTAQRGSARGSAGDTLEVWDQALARAGAALAAARLQALHDLRPHARRRFEEIAGRGRLDLPYVSSWLDEASTASHGQELREVDPRELESALATRIESVRPHEIERGLTLAGPQRDDVGVLLTAPESGELDARMHASQGDQRTCALALKLAEHDLLSDSLGENPVLLLDDVFSELDAHRRKWLASAVGVMGQTIVSSTEPLDRELPGIERVLRVNAGTLESHG